MTLASVLIVLNLHMNSGRSMVRRPESVDYGEVGQVQLNLAALHEHWYFYINFALHCVSKVINCMSYLQFAGTV